MSEHLLAAAQQQLCEHLLAIRKSGDWRYLCSSFDIYVTKRWSLSKTRAKLYCDFAKFCQMCRKEMIRIPDSPDNVKPILQLAQKRWIEAWTICLTYCDGDINAQDCSSVMQQYGIIANKKIPEHVLNGRRVRKAAKTMADLGDGEALVEQIGPQGLGGDWDMAVKVTIDADQARMDRK